MPQLWKLYNIDYYGYVSIEWLFIFIIYIPWFEKGEFKNEEIKTIQTTNTVLF